LADVPDGDRNNGNSNKKPHWRCRFAYGHHHPKKQVANYPAKRSHIAPKALHYCCIPGHRPLGRIDWTDQATSEVLLDSFQPTGRRELLAALRNRAVAGDVSAMEALIRLSQKRAQPAEDQKAA